MMSCFSILSNDKCVVALISLLPPILLLIVFIPNALLSFYRVKNSTESPLRLWAHSFRWLIFLLLFIVHVLQIMESSMSATRHFYQTSQFNYVFICNDILNLMAVLCIVVVYNYIIEVFRKVRFLWIMWIYWILLIMCCVGKAVTFVNYNTTSFHLLLLSSALYSILFLLDSHILATKVSVFYLNYYIS